MDNLSAEYELDFHRDSSHTLRIRLAGQWKTGKGLPKQEIVSKELENDPRIRKIRFDTSDVTQWDTGLLVFLVEVNRLAQKRDIEVYKDDLPDGIRRLFELAAAVPEQTDTGKSERTSSWLALIGIRIQKLGRDALRFFEFIGSVFISFTGLFYGKVRLQRTDFFLILQECGPKALPIITLISLLVGLILACVGAIQLRMCGAQIYVADLVGLGMAREMGAMMPAIVMAGRTGAAFAAQLGTMRVNEEIDALVTLGISPIDFLVLPRIISLTLMMPLLCIFANLMGILGGAIVGVFMLDISPLAYYIQTREAVPLIHFAVGIIKSGVFGVLVAVAGCMRGLECGQSAGAVGDATTNAVVTAIVWIIVSDALLTFIFNVLDM
jgi:phospholipid/cholesterol/gamma-HCH transport system permease protein